MRRLFGITMASLVACLILSNAAMAQQGQGRGGRGGRGGFGGGGFGGGITFLIQNSQVQKELKLSEDQTAKIKEVTDAARPQRGAGGGRGANLTDEQRQAAREEQQKRTTETEKKIADLLTADQNARLKQVQLWVQGTGALIRNDAVAKELSLTDDQKSALKTISDESGKKFGEIGGGGRGATDEERTKAREQRTALMKETEAECMAVLTDDQKAKFATLKGEKFELDMTQAFGGRGGRGGRGGNNNNN
jgi:Spy/CpxP family protein refolding chaperone